jgi:hypothetical protein
MKTIAITMLAAVVFAAPLPAVADGKPSDSRAKPSSFVPQPRTNRHVYGTPIQPAILGHAKAHHKPAPKKPPVRPSGKAKKSS